MKKINFNVGAINLLIGVISLRTAFTANTKFDSLLFALAGACISVGIMMIYKYIHWTSPKFKEQYMEKLENENIERHDELKEKVRGKSAQYTHATGLCIISISTVIFSILDSLGILENGNIFVFFLGGYFAFQIVIGSVFYHYLIKKY